MIREEHISDRRTRLFGALGVVLYIAVCAGVMFLTFTVDRPQTEAYIVVELGSSEAPAAVSATAAGGSAAAASEDVSTAVPAEEILTTEDPDAPEIASVQPTAKPDEKPAEPARQVNKQALFPGASGSSGGASGGSQSTSAAGSGAAQGTQGSGGFSLSGRYLVGSLPRPGYGVDAEGRVVIRITVNAAGIVTGAVYEPSGSTTNNGQLVEAARTAALKARFTAADAEIQTGTITYIFKLS